MTIRLLMGLCPLLILATEPEPATVNICDLAQNLAAHDGKVVAVRGTYFVGPHGATLAAEKCRRPSPFKEFGSGVAISLDINLDEGYSVPGPNGGSYSANRGAIEEFERKPDAGGTTATFVGVLHVKTTFKMGRTSRQGIRGNGYGQMGRYPAELSVITIRDAKPGPSIP